MRLVTLLAFLLPQLLGQGLDPAHHLALVYIRDARSLARIQAMDLDIASCAGLEPPVRHLEIIATDDDLKRLRDEGFVYDIVESHMEDAAERRLGAWTTPFDLTPPVGKGAMGGHYTLAQITAILDQLSKTNGNICAPKVSIGKSREGRDIWMVKISDNVTADEDEPEILFDALHHAREPVGATATLQFMDWLVSKYGKDPDATFLVDNRELYFVPCLNPDGYEYNRRTRPGGGGMWRKNRRDNGNGSFGVDLNRNWPTGWNAPHGGNSSNPSSSNYRGPAPLSEPEVLALENLIAARKFVVGISTHTWSGMVLLRPWGYLPAPNQDPANVDDYRKISERAVAHNKTMRAGATSVLLYTAAGTATDHAHAAHGMYAYLPELGGGFWPSPPEQIRLSNLHQPMFVAFARTAGAVLEFAKASMVEARSGNGNGRIDPGEDGHVIVHLENHGAGQTRNNAVGTLRPRSTGVTVVRGTHDFGRVPKFGAVANPAQPLVVRIPKDFPGDAIQVELTVRYDGAQIRQSFELPLERPVRLVGTDFEKSLGFTRSSDDTAQTGRFERSVPEQTIYQNQVIQPAGDHTPGTGRLCWVTDGRKGRAAGTYDVDAGKTSFLSPVMDLSHVKRPTLSLWLHYTESKSPGDPFVIEASTAPDKWQTILSRDHSTDGWAQIVVRLPEPATATMQLRFTARDLDVSLVEACIDDLEIHGIAGPAATTVLGTGELATTVRVGFRGTEGAVCIPLLATGTASIDVPGVGTLLLDPNKLVLFPPIPYGTQAHVNLDFDIVARGLVGKTFYVQQLLAGKDLALGNRVAFRVR